MPYNVAENISAYENGGLDDEAVTKDRSRN